MKSNEIFAFDEQSRPYNVKEESIQQVLEFSSDIRQCCMTLRIPQVKKGNNTVFVADMWDKYAVSAKGKTSFIWKRNEGITVTVDGPFGYKEKHVVETLRPLFFHFLQWKFCCWTQLQSALKAFIDDVHRKGLTVFQLDCFQFEVQANKFVFSQCS
jgi:hypothetical protein